MCVIHSLINNNLNKDFYSLELYPNMYEVSKNFLTPYQDHVKLLNGRIIEYDEVFWFDHSIIDFGRDLHAQLWYHKDLEYLKTTPNVFDKLPSKIDLLILDGGEYTTYPEWLKLKDRSKIVVLDDTNILKTSRIRKEILDSQEYKTIYDNLTDRNGFSIFEKL